MISFNSAGGLLKIEFDKEIWLKPVTVCSLFELYW